MTIYYKEGFKYQVSQDCSFQVDIYPANTVQSEAGFLQLSRQGVLTVRRGYAWDGPSGPAPDIEAMMQGSLAHDAIYQLFREGLLDPDRYKDISDRLLEKIVDADGLSGFMSAIVYEAVEHGGWPATDPKNRKKEISAGSTLTIRNQYHRMLKGGDIKE